MKRYGRHVSRILKHPLTVYPAMGWPPSRVRGQTRRQRACNGVFKRSRSLKSRFFLWNLCLFSQRKILPSFFYATPFLYDRSFFFSFFFFSFGDCHSQERVVRFVSGRTVRRWRDSICKSRGQNCTRRGRSTWTNCCTKSRRGLQFTSVSEPCLRFLEVDECRGSVVETDGRWSALARGGRGRGEKEGGNRSVRY